MTPPGVQHRRSFVPRPLAVNTRDAITLPDPFRLVLQRPSLLTSPIQYNLWFLMIVIVGMLLNTAGRRALKHLNTK